MIQQAKVEGRQAKELKRGGRETPVRAVDPRREGRVRKKVTPLHLQLHGGKRESVEW